MLSQEAARRHKVDIRQKEINTKNRTVPRQQLETEKRTEALDKALTRDNKGFALLQKMGYKPGMAIGKQGTPQN